MISHHEIVISDLEVEVERLKAELEMEMDQACRWSRKATALQAVADAARELIDVYPRLTSPGVPNLTARLIDRIREALFALDLVDADR